MDILATQSDLESILLDKAAEPKVMRLSLLEKITKNFSHELQIRKSGSAVLYKAMLRNGAVAVKWINMPDNNEFLQEVERLMKFRHRNIVRFLGYCAETQHSLGRCKGEWKSIDTPQGILCFEYPPKESLDSYIKGSSPRLDCGKRCTIIKGIFEATNYLHQQHIMHVDLSPSNILLDENMIPKVADFGMSRGYVPQEFTGHVLYRLCVIIIEILTGKAEHQAVEKMRSKPHHMSIELTGSISHNVTLKLLKDITNNFCSETILGRGGFSVVYKVVLPSGKVVAVKKLVQATPSLQKQFENEVNLLKKLDHPNIVRLVGYCKKTLYYHKLHKGKSVFAQNNESLVCLEYLPNGSLDNYISDASSGLDWNTRWEIIKGISSGLCYLHEQSKAPIIHLDLKPSNILFDENMIPKIADFGLSRMFDQMQTISSVMHGGTFGYMAPEYLLGIVTPMSDIFSLGVVIIEVITGHKDYPYDAGESSDEGYITDELQKWRNVLRNEPDRTLLQIEGCIRIGLSCVHPERQKRPTMTKIIDMLKAFA